MALVLLLAQKGGDNYVDRENSFGRDSSISRLCPGKPMEDVMELGLTEVVKLASNETPGPLSQPWRP